MIRVSIGPGDVAGYFSALKSGFDEIGIESEHFMFSSSQYQYEESHHTLRRLSIISTKLRSNRFYLAKITGIFLSVLYRIFIFFYALVRFDTFIFLGSWSFFNFYDLPILRLFKKKIIVVFIGSDARPPFFNGRYLDDSPRMSDPRQIKAETDGMRRRIRIIERYADHIINQTATDQLFTKEYIRFAAVGLPIRMAKGGNPPSATDTVKIVHAPSRPIAKGSLVFSRAIEELRKEGFSIDFVELTGVPNEVVLDTIASCDFVLDQLYSDTPMAMFATEAAMLGKPAVVGGYYAADYAIDNPDSECPPSLFTPPGEIKDAIRRMIEDRDFRVTLGKQARAFVRTHWNAAAVARRFVQIAEEQAPPTWLGRPEDTKYIYGWGLSLEAWRKQVGVYTLCNGWDATGFGHKPALIRKIKDELAIASPDFPAPTNMTAPCQDSNLSEDAPRA